MQSESEPQMTAETGEKAKSKKTERHILTISFVGSVLFLIVEALMAVMTHSKAVLMDCVWDSADLLMLIPMMIVVSLLKTPESEMRPFGFSQVESIILLVKCILLLLVTGALIVDGLETILAGGSEVNGRFVAIYELIICILCSLVYLYLHRQTMKINSPTAKTEIFIWKLDAWSTLGVSAAFFFQVLLEHTSYAWLAPYIDPSIAILLGVILIREPIKLAWKNIQNLVLFAPDHDITDKIRRIITEVLEDTDFECTWLEVVQTGRKLWIEVYFISGTDTVELKMLASIRRRIGERLAEQYSDVDLIMVPDLDV